MDYKMRRNKQEISKEKCEKVLNENTSGVLAVIDKNGYPYSVPLSYYYCDSKIYFHSALEGHKIDAIKNNEKASFCVIDKDTIVPEKFTTYYRSVIAFGKVKIIEGENEKREALKLLSKKYSPLFLKESENEINTSINRTLIIEFSVSKLSGKESIELIKKEND